MTAKLVENFRATPRHPYAWQHILSHEKAEIARRFLVDCPHYSVTPLRELSGTAADLGLRSIWYKDESERFALGSFKPLGGIYAVARAMARRMETESSRPVTPEELLSDPFRDAMRATTVTCATDGNHGRAVAAAARLLGCRAVIFLHADVSVHRQEAIEGLGAQVSRIGGNYDDAVRASAEAARENGWELVSDTSWPGYESVPTDVMQGYSVLVIETLKQLREQHASSPTHVFLQGGVGGLAAAVCAHLWESFGRARPVTIVVEPERADCLFQSASKGQLTAASGDLSTIMAGLSCGEASHVAWQVLQEGARFFMTIPDSAAVDAMRLLASGRPAGHPIVAGESGAAGFAGLLEATARPDFRTRIGLTRDSVVLSIGTEGATDPELYEKLVQKPAKVIS